MATKILRSAIVAVTILTAGAIGHLRAQSPTVDSWEIQIVAPTGRTTIKCIKGARARINLKRGFNAGAVRPARDMLVNMDLSPITRAEEYMRLDRGPKAI